MKTKEALRKICSFAFNSNLLTYKEVFRSDELAEHLWDKFTNQYHRDFLEFYNGGLDKNNQAIIEEYIDTH